MSGRPAQERHRGTEIRPGAAKQVGYELSVMHEFLGGPPVSLAQAEVVDSLRSAQGVLDHGCSLLRLVLLRSQLCAGPCKR